MGNEEIGKARTEKDLGVVIQDSLSPEKYINIITRTHKQIPHIKMTFCYMDKDMLRELISVQGKI